MTPPRWLRSVWTWLIVEKVGWDRPSPVTPGDEALRLWMQHRLERLEDAHAQLAARAEIIDRLKHQGLN